MRRAKLLLLWITFAILAAISVFSFFSERLLSQEIWTPTGRRHLAYFVAFYALWTVILRLWRASVFLKATCSIVLLYGAAVIGVFPIAAAIFILFICWVLGRSLLEVSDARDEWIALALGVALLIFTLSLAVHIRVNYWWTYLAAFAAILCFCRRAALQALIKLRAIAGARFDFPGRERLAIELLGLVLLAHFSIVLKPEVSADGLAMHLVIPAQVHMAGLWDFNFRHVVWAVMPMAGDWLFTSAYMLGGEFAARFINFAMLLACTGLLVTTISVFASPFVACLCAALFVSTPLVQLVTGSLFVENTWTVLLVGGMLALVRFHDSRDRRWLWAAGVLFGCSLSAKFGTASFLPAIFVAVAYDVRRAKDSVSMLPFVGLLVLFAAPPYLTAYLKTGNPVFPFLNTLFQSPYFDSTSPFFDARFRLGLHGDVLWQATFRTSQFLEGQNGAIGFHYFLLVPLTLVAVSRRWSYPVWLYLGAAISAFVLLFSSQSNLRYVYPAMALITVGFAAMMNELRKTAPLFRTTVVAAGAVLVLINLYFLPASGWYHRDFFLNSLFHSSTRERYLNEAASQRILVDELNVIAPGEAVLFLENNGYAGLRGTAYTNTWHHAAFTDRLDKETSAVGCLRLLDSYGIRWIVAPHPTEKTRIREESVRWFLDDYTERVKSTDGFYLARVRPEYQGSKNVARAESEAAQLRPVGPGSYDDFSRSIRLMGDWTRDRQFTKARNGTLSYTSAEGASFRFKFSGRSIEWIHTAAPNRGRARVLIDGKAAGDCKLYSPKIVWQASCTFDALTEGTHTLEVSLMPGGKFIDVDALVVR